jgi:(p)ppGpp synthase/HD superfamily hydrolase
MISKAERFAEMAHDGQFRKFQHQDRPYVTHVGRVAGRVSAIQGSTETMVVAAWLHDVIEDTQYGISDIEEHFGSKVADLVDELTNPSKKYPLLSRKEKKAMDRKHLALVSDAAKIIKLADRIDNLCDAVGAPSDFVGTYHDESAQLVDVLEQDSYEVDGSLIDGGELVSELRSLLKT